eukprot:gene36423-38191_t
MAGGQYGGAPYHDLSKSQMSMTGVPTHNPYAAAGRGKGPPAHEPVRELRATAARELRAKKRGGTRAHKKYGRLRVEFRT